MRKVWMIVIGFMLLATIAGCGTKRISESGKEEIILKASWKIKL